METLRKYILYFLVGIAICLVGASGVFAETITDMTFSSFRTTVDSYSITYNQTIYDTTTAVPVNMGIPNGFAFEWITNYQNNCTGQTIINGQMAIPNQNLNYDWLYDNINDIYYAPNINGVNGTACSFSINPSTLLISFTCSTSQPNNNFIIGGHLKYRANSSFNTYFRIYRNMNITCDNSATSIIDNQTQNTQDIINNNNQNTQAIIEANKVCKEKTILKITSASDFNSSSDTVGSLNSSGGINSSTTSWKTTNYFKVYKDDIINITRNYSSVPNSMFCVYDSNKTKLDCSNNNTYTITSDGYIRINYNGYNLPTVTVLTSCINGNQALDDSINNLNDNLTDDDTSGATDKASDFFSDFTTNTFGLTSIITAPLNLIQSITSSTCTQLELPLPYLDNKKLILPCMTTIYSTYFGTFFTLYQTITYGIIAYWVCVRIFNLVKDFKNPEHDEIEVLDL